MDYEDLVNIEVSEEAENGKQMYRRVKDMEDLSPAGRVEFEKAKSALSIVSPKTNLNLYDHLGAILRRILRYGITNAVDSLEEISQSLKDEKQTEESEFIEVTFLDENLQRFIDDKKRFFKIAPPVSREAIRTADEDDESSSGEQVQESDADLSKSYITQDLHHDMHCFGLAGIGLPAEEVFEMNLALRDLADTHKLEDVRFWGKIFAGPCDYYIAESKYHAGVTTEDFGWQVKGSQDLVGNNGSQEGKEPAENELVDMSGEQAGNESYMENETEANDGNASEMENENRGEDQNTGEEEEKKIPPLPEPQVKERKSVSPEPDGTGVNEYLYFVCTQIGNPWRCLPAMKPSHLTEARRVKRFLTGDLESEVGGCLSYQGKEAHYLRAQVARISASTHISPEAYYHIPGEEDENEENDEQPNNISKNDSYEAKPVQEMFQNGLDAWIHFRPAILDQGRCTPMKRDMEEGEDEEGEDEEEAEDVSKEEGEEPPEIFEAMQETEVPLLRNLSDDKAIGNLHPWNIKLSSKLSSATSIIILQSNLWPGAYTFYDGKTFGNVYIGFGYKYSTFHYAPTMSLVFQKEYEVGPDVIEVEDTEEPEVEDTEEPEVDYTEEPEHASDGEKDDNETSNGGEEENKGQENEENAEE